MALFASKKTKMFHTNCKTKHSLQQVHAHNKNKTPHPPSLLQPAATEEKRRGETFEMGTKSKGYSQQLTGHPSVQPTANSQAASSQQPKQYIATSLQGRASPVLLPLTGASRPAGGGTAVTAATSSQQERGGEGEEKGAAASLQYSQSQCTASSSQVIPVYSQQPTAKQPAANSQNST